MEKDEMTELYINKRKEYESKIRKDLATIEESVVELAQDGDYFSIQRDELLITIKAKVIDEKKHVVISTDENKEEIPLQDLTLTEHPDLIIWVIENDKLIEEGFREVLINAVRNGENIINTLKAMKVNYE